MFEFLDKFRGWGGFWKFLVLFVGDMMEKDVSAILSAFLVILSAIFGWEEMMVRLAQGSLGWSLQD